jgi:multiple sugar transport system substrate-binding protein
MKKRSALITRRDFIKNVGAGIAGAALATDFFNTTNRKAFAADTPELELEENPTLNVLRGNPFVDGDMDLWEQNCREWEQITGGEIINEYVNWEAVRTEAAKAAEIGAGPDVVFGWHDDPFLYPCELLEVTDVATYLAQEYDGWEDVCYKYGIKDEKWIAIPIGALGQQIVYRKSWLNEAGYNDFPTNVFDFIKCCKDLHSIGHPVGFPLGHAIGDGSNWAYSWLWAFGAKAVDEDGTPAINSPETRNSLEGMKELYSAMIEGCENWLDSDNNISYLAGNISATNNGISIYHAAKGNPEREAIAMDTYHAALPIGPISQPTELHLFNQAFIFKYTQYPNATKHFLIFMLENDKAGPWINAMKGYLTPALKYYRNLPVWTEDPKQTAYRDCVKNMLWNGYPGPIGPGSAQVMANYVIVDLFANYCAWGMSADQAISIAESEIATAYRKIILPDDDSDGVPNHLDLCDNTPEELKVKRNGCVEGDYDNDGDIDGDDLRVFSGHFGAENLTP